VSSESQFTRLFFHPTGESSEDERGEVAPRPWSPALGPPGDEIGVAVPLALVLARSENTVVALRQATVHSQGVTLDLVGLARGLGRREASRLMHEQHLFEVEEPTDAFLRIGLELPDGRRVSNLGVRGPGGRFASLDEPAELVFFEHGGGSSGGGGGQLTVQRTFWLWPLPEAGAIQVFCEWPALGIPLTSVELDVAQLAEAKARVVPLWPPSA